MSDRVTIKSIAQDLGISHMTVSRALSQHPKVHEKTRQKVLQRAQELGYVKSAAAIAMRGDKAEIVGLLVPNLINEFYARFSNKLAEICDENGWQPIIHVTNDDIARERKAILKLREIQAGAVVLVPAPESLKDEKKYLSDLQIIQLIRRRETILKSDAVLVDDTAAIIQAVTHLKSLGHTEIAYIGGSTSFSSGRSRQEAFKTGMNQADLTPQSKMMYTDFPSFAMGYKSAESIIGTARATAIICGGFEISNGALNAYLQKGLSIPEDISFIGYGDPSYYRWIGSGISTIKIPVDDLAINTAKILKQKWTGENSDLTQKTLLAELVIRSSSRKIGLQ